MRPIFVLAVCCVFAVLMGTFVLVRRVRRSRRLAKQRLESPAPREFFEAGEFRTPRPLHLEQEIFKQKPRRPLAEIHIAFDRHTPATSQPYPKQAAAKLPAPGLPVSAREGDQRPEPISIRPPAAAYATLFGQTISIVQKETSTQTKNETAEPEPVEVRPATMPAALEDLSNIKLVATDAGIDVTRRIPPQSVSASGLRRRVDLTHLGNTAIPYIGTLRGSGTQGLATSETTSRSAS